MDGDWARLASRLARARKASGLTQKQAWTALGVGRSSFQKMENPESIYAKVQLLHRSAARLYGWEDGSVENVLRGEEPILVQADDAPRATPSSADAAALEELTAGMSPRAIEALRRGSTVDTDVVDLAAGEPDVEAVLIFKSKGWEHVPAERKRAVLRKWAQLQIAAREIFAEEEPSNP